MISVRFSTSVVCDPDFSWVPNHITPPLKKAKEMQAKLIARVGLVEALSNETLSSRSRMCGRTTWHHGIARVSNTHHTQAAKFKTFVLTCGNFKDEATIMVSESATVAEEPVPTTWDQCRATLL